MYAVRVKIRKKIFRSAASLWICLSFTYSVTQSRVTNFLFLPITIKHCTENFKRFICIGLCYGTSIIFTVFYLKSHYFTLKTVKYCRLSPCFSVYSYLFICMSDFQFFFVYLFLNYFAPMDSLFLWLSIVAILANCVMFSIYVTIRKIH